MDLLIFIFLCLQVVCYYKDVYVLADYQVFAMQVVVLTASMIVIGVLYDKVGGDRVLLEYTERAKTRRVQTWVMTNFLIFTPWLVIILNTLILYPPRIMESFVDIASFAGFALINGPTFLGMRRIVVAPADAKNVAWLHSGIAVLVMALQVKRLHHTAHYSIDDTLNDARVAYYFGFHLAISVWRSFWPNPPH